MTREELSANLSAMADQYNMGADAMPIFDEIRADYDRYESSQNEMETAQANLTKERDDAIRARDEARQAYRDRFFNRGGDIAQANYENAPKIKRLEDIFNG